MDYSLSPVEYWLIFGFITIFFEIFFISGVGLVFSGFGAITTACIISLMPNMLSYQYTLFIICSFIWLGILWRPIQKYLRSKPKVNHSSDLIGNKVEVIRAALAPGEKLGQVKWSGTILSARLSIDVLSEQAIGTILEVKAVDGSIVVCQECKK